MHLRFPLLVFTTQLDHTHFLQFGVTLLEFFLKLNCFQGQPFLSGLLNVDEGDLLEFFYFLSLSRVRGFCCTSNARKEDGALSAHETSASTDASQRAMRLLCFKDHVSDLFWAAKDELFHINITADLIHQSVASFGNEARIGPTVIFRHHKIFLIQDGRNNIDRLFRDIECPRRKPMPEQVRKNGHTAPLHRLEYESMQQKAQADAHILGVQTPMLKLKQIAVRLEAMGVISSGANDGQVASGFGINAVMLTQHEFNDGEKSQMLIVKVIGFGSTMTLWHGTHFPMHCWGLVLSVWRWRQDNRHNTFGRSSELQ